MTNLKTVFNFEFKELIKKRALLISTLIVALIFLSITSLPRILKLFGSDSVPDYGQPSFTVAFKDQDLEAFFADEMPQATVTSESLDSLKDKIEAGDLDALYYVTSRTSYTVFQKDKDIFYSSDAFYQLIYNINKQDRLEDKGINPHDVWEAETFRIDVESQILGRDGQGFFVGYVFLFGLYMLILIYGQLVASSVAREKDSRTMELLITSTRPRALIVGKVLAAGLVGVIQVIIIALFILAGFQLNKSLYPPELLAAINTSTNLDVLLIYIAFSLMGYLLYLFIYAALGSLVARMEDLAASLSSITIIFILAYLVATTGMTAPNMAIVRYSSFIPFVALFTTPIRYMLTSVSGIEIIASLLIMAASTLGIACLSIYIYRQGSLNYGNKMSLIKMIGKLFSRKPAGKGI